MNIAKSLSFLAYSLFLILAVYLSDAHYASAYNYLYTAVCIFALISNWHFPNISSLIILLLIARFLEAIIFPHLGATRDLYIIQSFYFFLDLSITIVIALRPAICRQLELRFRGKIPEGKYSITNADMLVGAIYFLYLFVALLSIGEHVLRHLDHIGLEYSPWLNEHARVVWSNHTFIKISLNILEFVAILTTTKEYMRTRYKRF